VRARWSPADAGVGDAERTARALRSQDADAFRILFYTGIRIGELLTLRWADVDLDLGCCSCVATFGGWRPSPRVAATATCTVRPRAGCARAARRPLRVHRRRRLRDLQPLGAPDRRLGAAPALLPRLRGCQAAASQAPRAGVTRRQHPRPFADPVFVPTTSATRSSRPPIATSAPSTGPRTSRTEPGVPGRAAR